MKRLLLLSFLLSCIGTVSAQEVLDERVKKHYSEEQISQMTPAKIAMVNFYFSQSFEVQKSDKCADCPEPDSHDIDITLYESQRQLNSRASLMENKGQYRIVLLSVEELNAEYNRIKQEHNSKN